MMCTPCLVTVLPSSESAQLPPCSTAMSTITEPGFMLLTISSVISTGALRPGISAVAIAMLACARRLPTSTACRCIQRCGHRPRVAADALRDLALLVGFVGHVDELRAQRLDLLLDRGPHVGRLDDRAEPLGGGDRLQAGDAGAEDQHARGLDRAGRGHHHRHQPADRHSPPSAPPCSRRCSPATTARPCSARASCAARPRARTRSARRRSSRRCRRC